MPSSSGYIKRAGGTANSLRGFQIADWNGRYTVIELEQSREEVIMLRKSRRRGRSELDQDMAEYLAGKLAEFSFSVRVRLP